MSKKKTPKRLQREAKLLQELAIDFDWQAAAKRAKVPQSSLSDYMQDRQFVARGQKIIEKSVGDRSGINEAIKRFRKTQQALEEELSGGNLDIANSLIKTHEMEFKMHGLFEKDNKQKGNNVMINISFDRDSVVDIEGEVIEDV